MPSPKVILSLEDKRKFAEFFMLLIEADKKMRHQKFSEKKPTKPSCKIKVHAWLCHKQDILSNGKIGLFFLKTDLSLAKNLNCISISRPFYDRHHRINFEQSSFFDYQA